MISELENADLVVTFSSSKTFLVCNRKYYYRYIACLVPASRSEALYFGTLWHEILFYHYSGKDKRYMFQWIQNNISEYSIKNKIMPMYKAYLRKYNTISFTPEILEKVFYYEIMPGIYHALKPDGIITDNKNELALLEHKTASRIDGNYIERLPIDMQTNQYALGLRNKEILVKYIVYNAIQKPTLRLGKNESNKGYQNRIEESYKEKDMFYRDVLLIDEEILQDTKEDLLVIIERILDCAEKNIWQKNWTSCFNQYGNVCPYWPICRHKDNAALIQASYIEKEPHSELSEVAIPSDIF